MCRQFVLSRAFPNRDLRALGHSSDLFTLHSLRRISPPSRPFLLRTFFNAASRTGSSSFELFLPFRAICYSVRTTSPPSDVFSPSAQTLPILFSFLPPPHQATLAFLPFFSAPRLLPADPPVKFRSPTKKPTTTTRALLSFPQRPPSTSLAARAPFHHYRHALPKTHIILTLRTASSLHLLHRVHPQPAQS